MCVYVHVGEVARRGRHSSGAGATGGFELPYGCWELNSARAANTLNC